MPVLAFYFEELLIGLVWSAFLMMNLWIWQKTKARGNLLMIIGSGILALAALLWAFTGSVEVMGETYRKAPSNFVMFWMPLIGAGVLLAGFYFTAKPMVDVHLDALKKKMHDLSEKAAGGETPGNDGDA